MKKHMMKFLYACLLVGMCSVCYACGSTTNNEVQASNLNATIDMPEKETFTVLDVRERAHKAGSSGAYSYKTIVIVLENESGKRAPVEYRCFTSSDDETYRNLQILIPGDKVIYVGDNEFKLVNE